MKRNIMKILGAFFLALTAVFAYTSCEKETGPMLSSEGTAPVLENLSADSCVLVEGETFETLHFSAADFGVVTAIRYTAYVDIAGSNFANKQSLGYVSTDTAGLVIESATLNNALISLDCPHSVPVEVEFRIEAQMMGESTVITSVAALESNSVSASVTPYDAVKVYPSIYVIGDFCGWSHDNAAYLFSYAEDENNYVGVVDFEGKAGNGFKLTGAANWDNGNWGTGSSTSTEAEAPSLVLIDDGGSGNITNYSTYRYYNFTFVKSTLTLNMNEGFNTVGVIGLNGDWENDIEMTWIKSSGKFYADVEVAAATAFKFRLDNAWDVDWGGDLDALTNGGLDIAIEPGNYRIYLDINDWDAPYASLSTADYGTPVDGEEGGGDEPEDPEQPEDPEDPELKDNLWGVIGTFESSNWNSDIYMTEFPAGSGIWVSPALTFEEGTEFKLRYNNSWTTQAGAVTAGDTLRTGVPVTAGYGEGVAQNVGVAESQYGSRVVVYNANDNQIYLLGWGVVGQVVGSNWDIDMPMLQNSEGNWEANGVTLEGQFKLRWSGAWDLNRGAEGDKDGVAITPGTPMKVLHNGKNLEGNGVYDVVYNVTDDTILLTETK